MGLYLTAVWILAITLNSVYATSSTSCLNDVERTRLQRVLTSSRPHLDLQSAYLSITALSLLDAATEDASSICDTINKHFDSSDLESIYYAVSLTKLVKEKLKTDCKVNWGKAGDVVEEALKDSEASTKSVFYAVVGMKHFGKKVDNGLVSAALSSTYERDDSPLSAGFLFHAASYLGGDLEKFFGLIEDIIAQADDSDDGKLQFSGGLYPTAAIIMGAYKLAETVKKPPTITENDLQKFTSYFMSRKNVFDLQNVAALVKALVTLTTNPFHIPVSIYSADKLPVSEANPNVRVRVANLLCKSLGKVSVTADTARHVLDDAVVLSKKPFKPVQNDNTLFEYNFMGIKPSRGFYRIYVSVTSDEKENRLIGTSGAEVEVKVTTQIVVDSVEVAAMDKEQSMPSRLQKVDWPKPLPSGLHADDHQKVVMRFKIKDKQRKENMLVHQSFIKLTNKESKQEIVFVAEADDTMQYKFELDVGAKAKEFGHVSGKYDMAMIIGDAVIENPLSWNVAEVELVFPPAPEKAVKASTVNFAKKDAIKHIFRKPDSRPSATVSTIFTALVVLPVLVMLVLWMKIGVNVSNFSFSLTALGFHIGLGAIFALYFFYWLRLDMFQTINYLALIGIVTFLCGNQMLSYIANKRK